MQLQNSWSQSHVDQCAKIKKLVVLWAILSSPYQHFESLSTQLGDALIVSGFIDTKKEKKISMEMLIDKLVSYLIHVDVQMETTLEKKNIDMKYKI